MEIFSMNIGGVYFGTYLIGIPILFALFWLGNSWWETQQAVKKCSGNNILVLFHTIGGQAYFKWCKDEQGELAPTDMKGYDKKSKDMGAKAIAKIKASKQDFGWYAVLADHVFSIPYPLGSKNPKATARITEYVENFPMPRITSDLQKWNDEQYALVCSAMAEAAKDTGDIRAIISEAAGIEEGMAKMADVPNQIQSLKIFIYGIAGGIAIVLLMLFMASGKIDKIAAQYGITALLEFFKTGG